MKVWGLILGVFIVFVSATISQDAFAWKDKSKMTNDDRENERQRSRNCNLRCGDQLSSSYSRCTYIWADDAVERGRCNLYAERTANQCESRCN